MATPLAEEGVTWSRLLEPEPSAGLCARVRAGKGVGVRRKTQGVSGEFR